MSKFDVKQEARRQRLIGRAERTQQRVQQQLLSELKIEPMTPTQYREALNHHGITIVGASVYFGISRRQAQRIASEGPISGLIQKLLKLMADGRITKADLL